MVVFARSASELRRLLNILSSIFSSLGLQINLSKTKYQQLGHPSFNCDRHAPRQLQLDAGSVARVWQFQYLGSIIASMQPDTACANAACASTDPDHPERGVMILCDRCNDGYHLKCVDPCLPAQPAGAWFCPVCRAEEPKTKPQPPCAAHPMDAEIARRIASASAANGQLSKIWAVPHEGPNAAITLPIKLQFYNAFVLSALLYCSCTWSLTSLHLQRLETFHNSCLRRVKGLPSRADATNTRALHAAGAAAGGRTYPISAWLAQFRNRFVGHLARRVDNYAPTCMLFAYGLQGEGAPAAGRPRLDFSDMIADSFAAVLDGQEDAELRREMCADTDFWISMAAIRGWWRSKMVSSARHT
jgi:hypothetical protein